MKTLFIFLSSFLDENLSVIGITLGAFLLAVIITRAIFSIPTIVRHNKAQTLLLMAMAKNQGVDEATIQSAIDIVEPKDNPNRMISEKKTIRQLYKTLSAILIGALFFTSCDNNDSPCTCKITGRIYVSHNHGETWVFDELDGRSGERFPCSYDGMETNQTYGNAEWTKTVWECQ